MESTRLYKNGCDRTSALVDSCLDNNALCKSVGVCLKLKDICREVYHFEKLVYTLACLCRYGNADYIAAPFFAYKAMLCKLLLYLVGICRRLIHLVYRNYYRKVCSLCVIYRFYRLRHNAVVCGNNEYRYIRSQRTSCTHSGERLVSGSVKECNIPAACLYPVSADMLCDTACFAGRNVSVSDSVEERCLTVVNVSHNNNNG